MSDFQQVLGIAEGNNEMETDSYRSAHVEDRELERVGRGGIEGLSGQVE